MTTKKAGTTFSMITLGIGEIIVADVKPHAVVVATGGLSVPATGSDGTGLRIVRQLGHSLHETYAALTPVVSQPAAFGELSGVSLPVTVSGLGDPVALCGP